MVEFKTTDGIVDSFLLRGTAAGPLSGKTFVAKDLFNVEGRITGAGIPDWKSTHKPATETAKAVRQLLDAGADLIGKSLTDELAFSVDGINMHYGVPANPNCPGHIPGGSSSGSASAVASGLCNFALGTDTLGSVRVPSSYCGIYGIRPTHGRVSTMGVIPLGQSFDTVGWFARDPEMLSEVGRVLLGGNDAFFGVPCKRGPESFTIRFAPDLLGAFDPAVKSDFVRSATSLIVSSSLELDSVPVNFSQGTIEHFYNVMDVIRGWEAWQNHGQWMLECNPGMAGAIKERFMECRKISEKDVIEARAAREEIIASLSLLLQDTVICAPVTWSWPPSVDQSAEVLAINRRNNVRLNVLASVGGLPQIVIPMRLADGSPRFGLSFIAAPGCDESLLGLALRLHTG